MDRHRAEGLELGRHYAKYGILIARTDPDAPKHRGVTYFLIDMTQPGVDVRPLREMTGDAAFNEVFFDDARVHDSTGSVMRATAGASP